MLNLQSFSITRSLLVPLSARPLKLAATRVRAHLPILDMVQFASKIMDAGANLVHFLVLERVRYCTEEI